MDRLSPLVGRNQKNLAGGAGDSASAGGAGDSASAGGAGDSASAGGAGNSASAGGAGNSDGVDISLLIRVDQQRPQCIVVTPVDPVGEVRCSRDLFGRREQVGQLLFGRHHAMVQFGGQP